MRFTGKLTRNGNCDALIIPRLGMRALGWSADEPIVEVIVDGRLVVSSLRQEIDRLERESASAVLNRQQPAGV